MEKYYYSWGNDTEKEAAINGLNDAYANFNFGIDKATATDIYRDMEPGVSVFDEFTRDDYDWFRPSEASPKKQKEAIKKCGEVYNDIEIARSIIDLMSAFAYQGIRIVHDSKNIQKQYNLWWKKVKGKHISERFANYMFRFGNLVTVRETATLSSNEAKNMLKADAAIADESAEFPWRYWIYDPTEIEPISPDLARHSSNRLYGLKLDMGTIKILNKNKKSQQESYILDGVPGFIKNSKPTLAKNVIILPPEKTRGFSYMRTLSSFWADPIMRPMLQSFSVLKKAKLADLRALDGAISRIVHWKVGDLKEHFLPGPAVLAKFENTIMSAGNNGAVMNIVTGPEVDFKESNGDAAKFLGETKYLPILASIYAGFGIPPVLIGVGSAGMTNNVVSIKVLMRRIEYVRDMLIEFWEEELRQFQLAMGHKRRAHIYFDYDDLTDENTIKAMLIQLADRRIVSAETVQEEFGRIPEVEEIRLRRQREVPERDQPISALSDAQYEYGLKKIFAQNGSTTPTMNGLKLDEKAPGEITVKELQMQAMKNKPTAGGKVPTKNKQGVSGEGRPKTSKDGQKRKQRVAKASAENFISLQSTILYVSEIHPEEPLSVILDMSTQIFEAVSGGADYEEVLNGNI